MSFHEVRFPENISYGAIGGPERRTEIVTLASGFEERNTPWADSRRRYDAGIGMRSLDALEEVIAFFEARHGRLYGFRWKDWGDYKSCPPSKAISAQDQTIATGDGIEKRFQLIKTYRSASYSYSRKIKKPLSDTVKIAINTHEQTKGSDFTLDANSGEITFLSAPSKNAQITAGFAFDVPVRFDSDKIQISISAFQAGEIPNIPIIEIKA